MADTVSIKSTKKEELVVAKRTPIQDYLERTTVRRETPIPGSSGGMSNATRPGMQSQTRSSARNARPEDVANHDGSVYGKQNNWQKPTKLYDQNAHAIQKTLSERAKAEKAAAEAKAAAKAQAELRAKNARMQTIKLLVALVITVAIGMGLYFAMPELTRVQKVSVDGRSSMTEAEIVAALGLTPEVNLVNADLPAMEQRILANPKVRSVHIGRAFPDKLIVNLVERQAVACVLVSDAAGSRPVAIDVDGVAFADLNEVPAQNQVPILSGIRFENYKPGQRLPEFLQPLLSDLAALEQDSPSVLDAFSEIKVEKVSDADAELVLYPKGKTVPVRMPSRLTKANLGSALLVLDILSGRPDASTIQELDFRSGTIVYRTKEAQPG